MSQIFEKAKSQEEKGKFKNAANGFFEAAQTFTGEGKKEQAKEAFLKAIENAEKAQLDELLIEVIFSYGLIATKKEKEATFQKALDPIEQLIAQAESKNKNELLSELLEKKIETFKTLGKNIKDTNIELGKVLYNLSIEKITNKKDEIRKEGSNARQEASKIFDEIGEKAKKIPFETKVIEQLLTDGFLTEGLKLFEKIIKFCEKEKLKQEASDLIGTLIVYGKGILENSTSKKLIAEAKKILSETDPGGIFLDKIIEQALIVQADEKISEVAVVFADSADYLFSKKRYSDAAQYFDRAIALNLEIKNTDLAKNIANKVINYAKILFDIKGKFETGLKFYSVINQIEKLDLEFLGEKLQTKGEEMFQRNKIKIALEDFLKTADCFLKNNNEDKFNSIIKLLFDKSIILIEKNNLTNALLYAESTIDILAKIDAYVQLGKHLTSLSLVLIKSKQIDEAENYTQKAIDEFNKANDLVEAANTHKLIGEALLRLDLYQEASLHIIESSKLFKASEKEVEITQALAPLVISAKNLLAHDKEQLARDLIISASECARQINPVVESKVLSDFADHAINNFKPVVAFELLSQALAILGKPHPIETRTSIEKAIDFGKKLIPTENYVLGKSFIEIAIEALIDIDDNNTAGKLLLEIGILFQKYKQPEVARDLLVQISKIMFNEQTPGDFAETVSEAARNLVQYGFIQEGIEQLQKAIGAYMGLGKNEPVEEISLFIAESGKIAFQKNDQIVAKHLFISALEFSLLVNLEIQDRILTEATTLYLEAGDLYSLKEFYEFAKNNLEGEKDYLAKLARLIVLQATVVRDDKKLIDESSELIREAIKIFNQVGMLLEAGEVALSQGIVFIEQEHYIIGEELIETAAQIFLEIDDIERSGDAFLKLAEVNLARSLWIDAFRQINLANKSYIEAENQEKLTNSILKTAEIGSKSLIADQKNNIEFASDCYSAAINLAKDAHLFKIEIDVFDIQARALLTIKDYTSALAIFTQVVDILEKSDEVEKSSELAEEFSNVSTTLISDGVFDTGLNMVDLATGIFLRLSQPINASEAYMKACNALFKKNNIVDGVKLVLLASDTLMVANEYEAAANILNEIAELLFGLKDYIHASIVTGQIVTVLQKTGDVEGQKTAIDRLVQKAEEVIKKGKMIEGEQLWEEAANYSISANLEYAIEINNKRIEAFLAAGMYNSANKAFTQLLAIIEEDDERLVQIGDKLTKIAANLFASEEYELSKNFIYVAVDYYRKAKNSEKAKILCITNSENFIKKGDEKNGIELIDKAANIANEMEGAHEAAITYLTSGFTLIDAGFIDSGRLSVKKAVEIEKQAQNIVGCIELGELSNNKAAEMANRDIGQAIEIYTMAVYLFESAEAFSRAGDVCTIIAAAHFNLANVEESAICTERAVNYFLKDKNTDSALISAKKSIENARKLIDQNELTKAVFILERGRILVERIGHFDLLAMIIDIFMKAASVYLPNRKSAIGIFFLNRALDLAKSSPNPEENIRIINLGIDLAFEVINKKNSLAGARVIEIISNHPVALELMQEKLAEIYVEALKSTIEMEWNNIGKIARDALKFSKKISNEVMISKIVSILTKRANADIITNKTQLGFFFLDYAVRIAREANTPNLLKQIGDDCYEQLQTIDSETDLLTSYKLLSYCYQMFLDINHIENIELVGHEFVRLGSKDLLNDFHSIRGYEALLSARDIAVTCQSDSLMKKVVLGLLDFGKQLSSQNSNTTLSTLEDVINGLEAFEVPNSNRVNIEYEVMEDYIKNLISFGEKLTKSDQTFTTGYKIIELCLRVQVMTRNIDLIEKEIEDTDKNMGRLIRRANRDSTYKIKHTGLLLYYLHRSDNTIMITEEVFRTANELFQKKKYSEAMYFTEVAIKLNEKIGIEAELRNIGMFALNAGDKIIREGKIPEAMAFYELAVEAFDKSKDEESSSRLINTIFQTREWDADVSIAYKCYEIAANSALRLEQRQKAFDVATKCFNRGIAFIDQPRIPLNLSFKFIELAGKTMEDIGAIKEAANNYDNALLKYLRLMRSRKNVEEIVIELLAKIAVDRMAGCDMDSFETIFLRVGEFTEMKKSKFMKNIASTLKLIGTGKIEEAWNTIAALPYVSHGRIRRIMNLSKGRILYDLNSKGVFDRTIFSSTDRSLPLSDYLIQSLVNARKVEGQSINKDVFISQVKLDSIRKYFYSEYDLWGRIEVDTIVKEFNIQQMDVVSIIRREFLSSIYMAVLNNTQNLFLSNDRLKAELSLIINREKKKDAMFDPLQAASQMHIPPDIIKEVLREIACEEVVEKALEQ